MDGSTCPIPVGLYKFHKGRSSQILAGFISQPRSLYQQKSSKSWELTVLQPVMGGDSDFDFQQFIPLSTAEKVLVLTHSETQAVDVCLIWEFPSLSSSFSSNIGSVTLGVTK